MTVADLYQAWTNEHSLSPDLQQELATIADDKVQIENRFFQPLSFGTGGMRGIIGAGTNRINIYTIRLVAEGLALLIQSAGKQAMQRGVVIAYDTRHLSKAFALETAKTIGKYNIRVLLFKESRPTPQLSFAIRHLNAFAGVVITASHNPAQYNGFKAYGEDGGQLPPTAADQVVRHMKSIQNIFSVNVQTEEYLLKSGLLLYVLEELDFAYQECLLTLKNDANTIEEYRDNIAIVYTPLHGSGLIPVTEGLKCFGFTNVTVVPEQANPDPEFPTVLYPNPEDRAAFEFAIQLARTKNAELLLATDPDADRLGVAVKKSNGEYELLTGNQLGALLIHYILHQKEQNDTLPLNGIVMKTIVTSELGRAVATKFGIATLDTLTGFKFISEKIEEFEMSKEYTFLFGYEESYGYLIGSFSRDKDAVQAALMTAEMAAYYKSFGKSLYDALIDLFNEFGYFLEELRSITLEGKEGQGKIVRIMESFRNNPPHFIGGIPVAAIEDYQTGLCHKSDGSIEKLDLPQADVLKFFLEDESWVCIRPSGTEPKCKFYFGVRKETEVEAKETIFGIVEELMLLVDRIS
ncbi:phospho-sugar mutase [Sporosarcina sp. CAU 1771]